MLKKFCVIATAVFVLLLFPLSVFAVDIQLTNAVVTDDEVVFTANITGLTAASCPNTDCFLQAMFTKSATSPRYFGYTQNNSGSWYEYIGSPEESYIQSTFFRFIPTEGSWVGELRAKNNPNDSDYEGPGDYFLRVKRYTGNSSQSTSEESNDLTVIFTFATPTPTPSPTPTATPTPTPSPSPTPTPTPTKSPTPKPTVKPSPTPQPTQEDETEETPVESPQVLSFTSDQTPIATEAGFKTERKLPLPAFFLIGGGVGLVIVAGVMFLRQKRREYDTLEKNEIEQ